MHNLRHFFGLLAVVVALAACTVAQTGGGERLDYMGLYGEVQKASYSVGYEVKGDLTSELEGGVSLAIVHAGTRTKNTVAVTDALAVQAIASPDGTVTCQKVGRWSCDRATGLARTFGAEDLLAVLGFVSQSSGMFNVETYGSEIVGVPVRCLRATSATPAGELLGSSGVVEECITAEGVPLKVVMPGLALDGVWYQPSADRGAFTPPA